MKFIFTGFIIFLYSAIIQTDKANSSDKSGQNEKSGDRTAFVSGKVVDERGFPVPYAKVIIRDSETQTDVSGKFNIMNVESPYDLTVAVRTNSTAVIYKNLSISNPEIVFFGEPVEDYYNIVRAKVNFPKLTDGKSGILKFISQEVSYSEEKDVAEGDSASFLKISWPMFQNRINGQIVFIVRNKSGFQTIKFTDVSVVKSNLNQEYNITSKPGKKLSSANVSVYFPENSFESKGLSLSANLFNYDKGSGIMFFKNEGNESQIKIVVPDKLPVSFKIRITGYADRKNGSGFVNYTFVSPGSVTKIDSEQPPEIMTPTDNSLAVDGRTRFSYTSGSGTGIYVLQFRSNDPPMNFYVVTNERESNLEYLSRKEFKSGSVKFNWNVRKYTTYFNTDEFVKPLIFKNDMGYKAVLYSSVKYFKTGYY